MNVANVVVMAAAVEVELEIIVGVKNGGRGAIFVARGAKERLGWGRLGFFE